MSAALKQAVSLQIYAPDLERKTENFPLLDFLLSDFDALLLRGGSSQIYMFDEC